jgi:hypothetical protein
VEGLFSEVRRHGVLGTSLAGSYIAPVVGA